MTGDRLDQAALLALVGGDEQLMHEIIDIYLEEYPRLLVDIRSAAARGDVAAVQFGAHSLKGSVGNMAGADAFAAAAELETLARSGRLDDARGALVVLERELTLLQEALVALTPDPIG